MPGSIQTTSVITIPKTTWWWLIFCETSIISTSDGRILLRVRCLYKNLLQLPCHAITKRVCIELEENERLRNRDCIFELSWFCVTPARTGQALGELFHIPLKSPLFFLTITSHKSELNAILRRII
jgi:hypothetical protein